MQTLNTAKSLSGSQLKSLNKNGKTLQCLDYQTLSGYGVQIYKAQRYYALYIQCKDTGGNHIYSSSEWQTSLSNDVSFGSATNIIKVFFPILSGGFIADGDSIALTSYGSTKTVTLGEGYISVQ